MSTETIIALAGFAFVMSISPGPGNFLLLASGANFGLLRSLPLILGISVGFLSMVLGVGLGLGGILEQFPAVYIFLRLLCGIYVFWLAFKIAKSRSLGSNDSENISKPISFIQAALFQLLNPKAWTVALIVTVTYTTQENYLLNLLLLIGIFAIINIPSISTWAISGAALRRILEKGNRIAVFNISMAILLVFSMIPMIIN
ncbi:LysE family transporter [Sneathiella sp. P13V-1]|uniref:LysE family translocator n=1 Tax=Sneathiella sp. P13V-1 TaxID=2697366 RepID=UPI00187BA39C|nr:LysE family translocator [Sneathiella sp. P13V-1]MBE7637122.1 LysE family transporter [Sneathiella sp. P13V-1]